ncbi:MAG: FUSC family protein [Chitinophagaceae bacterium]|jgi:uncharacterized membrane protein (TIGR01666 family)|nr:FUSC family protein [Chitinophagaceae bacterium]
MDYQKSYKNFIGSYNVTEGLRKTAGILIPAFVLSYMGWFDVGIVMAIGALSAGIADNPGSIRHQRNGLLVANAFIFISALATGMAAHSAVMLGVVLVIFSFLFSMLGVYGSRVNAIGIAGLIAMTLNTFELNYGWDILWNSLYLLAGGIWYMLLTLLLYSFRPYKATKQMLGELVQNMAIYLQSRAAFYNKNADYNEVYNALFQEQVKVQDTHQLVGDMIFQTRSISRESTHTGRILMIIYLDVNVLFERINTSYQDYKMLHQYFDETDILSSYKRLILLLSDELEAVGIALKTGEVSQPNMKVDLQINRVKVELNDLRHSFMKPENIEGFIYLRNIISNIRDISDRINRLHQYTSFDAGIKLRKQDVDHETFISQQDYSPKLLLDSLSLKSDIFRHSLRLSLAVLTGFFIGELFTIGHSYWILMTIIIILKPAYSLTKQRNKDRLEGTIVGIFIGVLILLIVKNTMLLFIILVLLMTVSNSLLRTYYFWSVVFMTPYVLIFFNFLYSSELTSILLDRLIDTAIGSAIAFVASFLLLPSWEHQKLKHLMLQMLHQNLLYFKTVADSQYSFEDSIARSLIKARKNAFVALSNLTGSFNRMLTEPKSQQSGLREIHQFIVLNHILISHIASLSQQLQDYRYPLSKEILENPIHDILVNYKKSIALLSNKKYEGREPDPNRSLKILNQQSDELMEKRKKELKDGQVDTETLKPLIKIKSVINQYNFIYHMTTDLEKVSGTLNNLPD